jgi:hypothetical protein
MFFDTQRSGKCHQFLREETMNTSQPQDDLDVGINRLENLS